MRWMHQYVASNRVTISSKCFHTGYSHTIPTGAKTIAMFDQYLALAASIAAGPLRVVNISTVEYRSQHLCVVRLPLSTNAAAPHISESCL